MAAVVTMAGDKEEVADTKVCKYTFLYHKST